MIKYKLIRKENKMKGKQIRQITDGSIIVAIYGMIFLLSRFTGGQIEYSF